MYYNFIKILPRFLIMHMLYYVLDDICLPLTVFRYTYYIFYIVIHKME
jgi:hypothetical protein